MNILAVEGKRSNSSLKLVSGGPPKRPQTSEKTANRPKHGDNKKMMRPKSQLRLNRE